jgi:hypothetical protein
MRRRDCESLIVTGGNTSRGSCYNCAIMRTEKIPPTISLIRHTGLLIGYKSEEYKLVGSPENIRPLLDDVTHKNLIFGWWSPLSLCINPSIILGNYILFSQYKSRYTRFYKNEQKPPAEVMSAKQSVSTGVTAGLFKYIIPMIIFITLILVFTIATQ